MYIEVPHGGIHAEIRGEGIPVLILHGGGLDHRHMLDALEPVFLETSGWKRVYIDLPGHGRSEANDSVTAQDDVLSMISAFADAAFRGKKFAVIGESRGSYHAMALVHQRPQDIMGMMLVVADGMVAAAASSRPPHEILRPAPEEMTRYASQEAKARFSRLVVQRQDILEKIERTKVPAAALADKVLADRIRRSFEFSFDLTAPTVRFAEPCLIVNGRQDAISGYRDMMDAIERYPHATLAILDRAGHSLSWEQPALFKALALEWLDRMTT